MHPDNAILCFASWFHTHPDPWHFPFALSLLGAKASSFPAQDLFSQERFFRWLSFIDCFHWHITVVLFKGIKPAFCHFLLSTWGCPGDRLDSTDFGPSLKKQQIMEVNRLIFTNLGVWNMFINICREAQENWFRAKDQCWNTINSHRPDAQMKTAKPCMKSQSVLNRRHLLRAGAFFFSIVVKICQIENTLQFSSGKWSGFRTVSLPDTSAAHLLGYCSHWFQSNPGGRCLSSNLHIQFPPLFLFFFSVRKLELK